MSRREYLEAALVSGTHGVRGAVRLHNLTDSPEILASIATLYCERGGERIPLHMEMSSIYKGALLATFREIKTLEDAILLKGKTLFASRSDIPLGEGDHFIADMLGLPVIDCERGRVGTLCDVICPASQQIYVVRREDGSSFMIPAVPEFIESITTEGDGTAIRVRLIPGMAD